VAAGRLALVARYDDRRLPDLDLHTGRAPADLGVLGRLADGSLPPQRTVPLRRHLGSCRACEDVVEILAKGRRLAAGLPVVAMPDDAREAMIDRVRARAVAVLPSIDEVMLAIDEDDDDRPAVSPVAVVLAIVLALVLGVAVAAVTSESTGGQHALVDTPTTAPTEQPSFTLSPTPVRHRHSARPTQTPTTAPTSASPSSTPSATQSPTHRPARASIALSPTSGPRGTTVAVSGRGWTPGSTVTVQYRGSLAPSTATATADAQGNFLVQVKANGALPGSYTVQADSGAQSAAATFEQTT
jgi:hypothetical protein